MSPHPAVWRNGACTGSLWKSHSRLRANSPAAQYPTADDAELDGPSPNNNNNNNGNGNGNGGSPQKTPNPSLEALSSNIEGILAEANERQRVHEFCVLVGNTLWSYSDVWAYSKGDPPTSEIRIVGASAWNPPSVLSPLKSGSSTSSSNATKSADFLIITYSGTHARCSAPTPQDKDEWLAALHAGLEGNIMENRAETLIALLGDRHRGLASDAASDICPKVNNNSYNNNNNNNNGDGNDSKRRTLEIDTAGGTIKSRAKSDAMVQSAIAAALSSFRAEDSFRPVVPPLPQKMRRDKKTMGGRGASAHFDDAAYPASSHTHCTACGKFPPESKMHIDAAPLPEYGMEVRVDLCDDCYIAQGVLRHVRYLGWLYEVEASDRSAVRMAWREVKEWMERGEWENAGLNQGGGSKSGSGDALEGWTLSSSSSSAANKGTDEASARSLMQLVSSADFAVYRQRSNTLDSLCRALEKRKGNASCALDFLESIEECAEAAESCCFGDKEEAAGLETEEEVVRQKENISLKKEAFKVAGDMSAALKLLYEYALPPERRNSSTNGRSAANFGSRDNADMLASILEFFLDLCAEGQMDALAFFWPQLCHVHMQMLPPRDTEEMIRVELMEDFLLTVSARYSVHLALDLVWGLTADLEESIGMNCNANSRRRRFAILRFVSELESLLFDFDGGWGGGGVSLRGMLSPSRHQAALLRDAMSLLQLRRRFGSHRLSKSVRLDKLRAEELDLLGFPTADDSEERAHVAKNASYFSSHITFARKLGDVAEKLRFMDKELRSDALSEELKDINAAGKILGGDPLNRLCGDGTHQKTVYIPINEGHVFNSKERTPVLLLAEAVRDPNAPETPRVADECIKTQHYCPDTAVLDPPKENVNSDIAGMDATKENGDSEVTGKDAVEENGDSTLPDSKPEPKIRSGSCDAGECSLNCVSDDEDGKDNGDVLCPLTPSSPHQALAVASDESPGRLSHGVLALTPRVSEATDVTEEGKEMMADMIANLIVNQKNHVPPPPLGDGNAENVGMNHGEIRKPHHAPELDHRRGQQKAAIEDVVAQSLPGLKGSRSVISTLATVAQQENARKVSALGSSVFPQSGKASTSGDLSKSAGIHLTAEGQFRRDVLFAIMEKGMRGNNVIAQGAATAARRAIQAMDRKRAIALLNEPAANDENLRNGALNEGYGGGALGFHQRNRSDITINAAIDEGEVMEALRLLIIQNQVAQENLSTENAVKANGTLPGLTELEADSELPEHNQREVDAGEVDKRLAGCGKISSSILSALRLWKGGIVSNGELLELVQKDLQFLQQSAAFGSADEKKLIEDSAFWGRFSFGERWAEKKARLAASSPHGSLPGWDLVGFIVKSNDDLRQEVFVMQLIGLCEEAFRTAGLDLWVHPYVIVATGLSTGIIECVRNAMSFDSLKKRPGYGTDGLVGHFQRMTEIAADPFKELNKAKQNFVSSLAAYSLMSYLFMFKDRHNGNLLLDTAGHVIHIDFGFVFGIAPGGSFSLEQSTPFKLTDEMLEVMGGLGSPLFSEFVTLFCCGFLALQAHADTFLTVVEVTCRGSNFPCFDGKDPEEIVSKLRERFCPELSKSQTVAFALDLIKFATTSYGTKQYDYFQYLSQGIAT